MKILIFSLFHMANFLTSLLFPKTKNIWIYGEWFGDKIGDNSYYAYCAQPQKKHIRKIWITKNGDVIKKLSSASRECYHAHSIKGLFYQARAGVFFCSVNSKDFCFSSLTPRVIYFQLWHGLPLKKIGFDVKHQNTLKRIINWVRSKTTDRYTYILSPSPHFDECFASAFKVNKRSIIHSLYPRCDGFRFVNMSRNEFTNTLGVPPNSRIAFYLPTHRNEGKDPKKIAELINNIKSLNALANKANLIVIIKPHYYDSSNFSEESFGNIIITKSLPCDLYESLSFSDFIITDYSSISLDYMITGKPIFFYTPDMDDYEKNDRPGYFNYSSILLGAAHDINTLADQISEYTQCGIPPTPLPFEFPATTKNSISYELQILAENIVYGH